jgi:hypothetical protein
MTNNEIGFNLEEVRKQSLKNSILRKARILADDGMSLKDNEGRPETKSNKNILIDNTNIREWRSQHVLGQVGEDVYASVYLIPDPFKRLDEATGIPVKTEIYAKKKIGESNSINFCLDELDNGRMRLFVYTLDISTNAGRDIADREATVSDLEMFDKVLDAAVSKELGNLPWEKQEIRADLRRGNKVGEAFMEQYGTEPEDAAFQLRYPHSS